MDLSYFEILCDGSPSRLHTEIWLDLSFQLATYAKQHTAHAPGLLFQSL